MKKTGIMKQQEITREWRVVDLDGQVLGRAATKIAQHLMGKMKPSYTPNMDGGDYVVALNASKIALTRGKETKKVYRHHTGHPGGFREIPYMSQLTKDVRKIVETAVYGMLPKNKLRDMRIRRLKVFTGGDHPYGEKLAGKTQE